MDSPKHRFRLGQSVRLAQGFGYSGTGTAVYKIVKLLPSTGDQFQYKISSSSEAFERTALEGQLSLIREA